MTINIPAGWTLEDVTITSACNNLPWAVFRAYALDGLSEFRATPVFGWRWATDPRYFNNGGCLPLTGEMSAAEFLQNIRS